MRNGGRVHHSDRGVHSLSIKDTERPAETGIEPSVASAGGSYDNARAKTINRPYNHRRGPGRSFEAAEYATLEPVDWFNNRRLLRAHRQHPAGQSQKTLLRYARAIRYSGVTQTKQPPGNPRPVQLLGEGEFPGIDLDQKVTQTGFSP